MFMSRSLPGFHLPAGGAWRRKREFVWLGARYARSGKSLCYELIADDIYAQFVLFQRLFAQRILQRGRDCQQMHVVVVVRFNGRRKKVACCCSTHGALM